MKDPQSGLSPASGLTPQYTGNRLPSPYAVNTWSGKQSMIYSEKYGSLWDRDQNHRLQNCGPTFNHS